MPTTSRPSGPTARSVGSASSTSTVPSGRATAPEPSCARHSTSGPARDPLRDQPGRVARPYQFGTGLRPAPTVDEDQPRLVGEHDGTTAIGHDVDRPARRGREPCAAPARPTGRPRARRPRRSRRCTAGPGGRPPLRQAGAARRRMAGTRPTPARSRTPPPVRCQVIDHIHPAVGGAAAVGAAPAVEGQARGGRTRACRGVGQVLAALAVCASRPADPSRADSCRVVPGQLDAPRGEQRGARVRATGPLVRLDQQAQAAAGWSSAYVRWQGHERSGGRAAGMLARLQRVACDHGERGQPGDLPAIQDHLVDRRCRSRRRRGRGSGRWRTRRPRPGRRPPRAPPGARCRRAASPRRPGRTAAAGRGTGAAADPPSAARRPPGSRGGRRARSRPRSRGRSGG